MEFQTLIDSFAQFGQAGYIAAFVVLIAIYAARKLGVVASGQQARFANVLLSAVLSGLAADPGVDTGLQTVIISLAAGLLHTLLEYLGNKAKPLAG